MVQFPIDVVIGESRIPSHFLLNLLAYGAGLWYVQYLSKKHGDTIASDHRSQIFLGAFVGAFIGSLLLAALEDPALFLNPPQWWYYLDSQTVVGGLLGGLIGVELTKRVIGVRRSSGDLITYPIILGMIIGRIGCFLTGVSDRTVGLASSLPWAFNQGDGIARHPTALYEIAFLLALWGALLVWERRHTLADGRRFQLFLSSYLLFRFLVEFIKPRVPLALGLSAIQLACVAGLIYYGWLFSQQRWSGRTRTTTTR